MTPCNVVEFKTPKGFTLNGLWYGPTKPKRVLIFVHGLTGSIFGRSERTISQHIVDTSTAVLTFNNRGYGIVNKLYKEDNSKKGYKRIIAGAAHEKFVDCVDDIQGAVDFVRKQGVKNIFLAGHSTGCQKSIYWAYKKKSKGVKGIVLLAPVSDYAVASERADLQQKVRYARSLIKKGESHTLLKGESYDAQRFLSLYTPDSPEEIFTYVQPKKIPRMLRSIRAPILVLWAEEDQFNDRSVAEIADWFKGNVKKNDRVRVIPNVSHGFNGGEKTVAKAVRAFMGA